MGRVLIGLGFNIAVAVALYFFGASLTTCWFTFLILCGFAGAAELSEELFAMERKLDSKLDKIERRLIVILGEEPGALEKYMDFEKRFEKK